MYWKVTIVILSVVAANLQASELSPSDLSYTCKDQSYDPNAFDFNDPDPYIQQEIRDIEKHHFNEKVRKGIGGQTGYLIADLAFILRNVPNHYPALSVIGNYYLAGKPSRGYAPADCFFLFSQTFRPYDGNVALIYGIFLAKSQRYGEAERQYLVAIDNLAEPAEAHYNLGLLYLKTGQNERALEQAKVAYSRGYPLPGLKRKLQNLGIVFD